jgi:hypothetical protein
LLSIIGLSLDIVGAVSLVLGLFSHMQPSTYGGPIRRPEDTAHDAAFGLVGAPLLIAGFAFQSLTYLDVRWNESVSARLTAGGLSIVLTSLLGWLVYGWIYGMVLRAEERYVAEASAGDGWTPPTPRFRRLRFWLG